jgi:tRNA-dependent cyclodipeptide synthase
MFPKLILEGSKGVSENEILEGRHNLWLGISDSKWFNEGKNLEALFRWAYCYTRDTLFVWIPGRLYAININHIECKSRAKALARGYEKEGEFRLRLQSEMALLDRKEEKRVIIADYDDVLTPSFIWRRNLLYREFAKQELFYERLMEIAETFLRSRGRTVSVERKEAVALYQLQELPMFLACVRTLKDDVEFSVEAYPGFGPFDELVRQIVEGRDGFGFLKESLQLKASVGILSITSEKNGG